MKFEVTDSEFDIILDSLTVRRDDLEELATSGPVSETEADKLMEATGELDNLIDKLLKA